MEDKTTNHWRSLAADLGTDTATLDKIQTAMSKPVLNCEFYPTLGPLARFPHLAVPKNLTHLFAHANARLGPGPTTDPRSQR